MFSVTKSHLNLGQLNPTRTETQKHYFKYQKCIRIPLLVLIFGHFRTEPLFAQTCSKISTESLSARKFSSFICRKVL